MGWRLLLPTFLRDAVVEDVVDLHRSPTNHNVFRFRGMFCVNRQVTLLSGKLVVLAWRGALQNRVVCLLA